MGLIGSLVNRGKVTVPNGQKPVGAITMMNSNIRVEVKRGPPESYRDGSQGKMRGQPTRVLLKLYNQNKGQMIRRLKAVTLIKKVSISYPDSRHEPVFRPRNF